MVFTSQVVNFVIFRITCMVQSVIFVKDRKLVQRLGEKFYIKHGKSDTEILRVLGQDYGDEAMGPRNSTNISNRMTELQLSREHAHCLFSFPLFSTYVVLSIREVILQGQTINQELFSEGLKCLAEDICPDLCRAKNRILHDYNVTGLSSKLFLV